MTYLQRLPDPTLVIEADCEKIHEIMKRLIFNRNVKIDIIHTDFKQYSTPKNHQKYPFLPCRMSKYNETHKAESEGLHFLLSLPFFAFLLHKSIHISLP